jgi:hypothetical protein
MLRLSKRLMAELNMYIQGTDMSSMCKSFKLPCRARKLPCTRKGQTRAHGKLFATHEYLSPNFCSIVNSSEPLRTVSRVEHKTVYMTFLVPSTEAEHSRVIGQPRPGMQAR